MTSITVPEWLGAPTGERHGATLKQRFAEGKNYSGFPLAARHAATPSLMVRIAGEHK
ncbi:hypothetical protein KBY28_04775 [Ruegeria pomeroyi]|nr:hypothetical protein [Ruegeria pomeroyi]